MTSPLVTIGVPVYNGDRYLAKALDTLLAQTFDDFEIVVSDNGSRDRTGEICREYLSRDPRIRYVRSDETVSPIGNFCRTVELARGRYFTWTAVDDVRPPEALGALVAALNASPAAVMAHGPVIADWDRLGITELVDQRFDLEAPSVAARVRTYTREMRYNAILYGLYRLDTLKKARFRQHPGHDYLLPLQVCALGQVAYTPTTMLTYQHVWGETDTPMYRRQPITLRDLLLYRGVRRHKCWITLALGAVYLWRLPLSALDRLAATRAHLGGFARRYWRHLVTEVVFLAFTPLAWSARPFAPVGRRLKRAWAVRGIAT
jgi:glycosyltransferase involved in cell wall biosynthesis